jgi:hypothetical protein
MLNLKKGKPMKKLFYILCFFILPTIICAQNYDFKQIKVDSIYNNLSDVNTHERIMPATISQVECSKKMVVWSSNSSVFIIYNGKLNQINDSLFLVAVKYSGDCKQLRFVNDTTFMCLYIGGMDLTLVQFKGTNYSVVYKDKPPVSESNILGFDFDSKGKIWLTTPLWYYIMIDNNKQDLVFGKDTLTNKDTLIDKYWAHLDIIPYERSENIEIHDDEIYYITNCGITKYNIASSERIKVFDESKSPTYKKKYYSGSLGKLKSINGKTWFTTKEPALIGFDKYGYEKINLKEYSFINTLDTIREIYDFVFDKDGSIWLTLWGYGAKDTSTHSIYKLFHIIDKDNYVNTTKFMDKFSYLAYYDSLHNRQVSNAQPFTLAMTENGTLYVGTQTAGLVYLGENPLTVVEKGDNNFALWKVYPNPARSFVKAELHCNSTFNPAETEISLYDYLGRLKTSIERFTISHDPTIGKAFIEFNTSGIPKGLYFLCIKVGEEKNMEGLIIE